MLDALALRRQQLDELGAAVLLGRPEDLRQIGAETCPLIIGVTSGLLTLDRLPRGLRRPFYVALFMRRGLAQLVTGTTPA